LALLALLLAVYGSDHRLAIPFAVGVAMTAIAALTFVPALLALLGRVAFYPFVPAPGKARPRARGGLLSGIAVGRPAAVAIGAAAVLIALASFAPRIRTSYDLLTALPASSPARQGFGLLARTYGPGSLSPLTVLVVGQGPDVATALGRVPGVRSVDAPTLGTDGAQRVAAYQVTLATNPLSNGAMAAVPALRRAAEDALGGTPAKVYVAGATAQNLDSADLVARDTAVVIPVVLALVALLLVLYLRSGMAAAYLVATVVLSFAASLGLGWIVLHYLLGVQSLSGGLVLYAFVFLVALGEDYNIFMISRIWEERRRRPMPLAVAEGARTTGAVITAAGLILAGTFAVLTALPLQIMLEFGVVTALGVLVDTFIVRSALVPAITVLLKDRALWPRRAPLVAEEPLAGG
jgi:RND superfamily putative drug exporter